MHLVLLLVLIFVVYVMLTRGCNEGSATEYFGGNRQMGGRRYWNAGREYGTAEFEHNEGNISRYPKSQREDRPCLNGYHEFIHRATGATWCVVNDSNYAD